MLIQVTDQGVGISPENLDKTFDPFFTTKENGTGLGLPVAHQIISQHGGVLSVENNTDRGPNSPQMLSGNPSDESQMVGYLCETMVDAGRL